MSTDLSENNTVNIFFRKPVSILTSIFAIGLISALSFTTVLSSFSNFKNIISQSAYQENNLAQISSAVATAPMDKWHPGIYVKIEDWQLQNPNEMAKIYQELIDTPSIRGIKVVAKWGRYESRDTTTGISTYNFAQIDEILAKLATLDNKHLILSVPWREFDSNRGASEILPNDMRGGQVWGDDPVWQHTDYDYLWAYKTSATGTYGYNLKLWDTTVISRLDAFLAALAEHVDNNPNFNHIATTESSISGPIIPFISGEGTSLQEVGQIEVIRMMKKHFTNSYVIPAVNLSRKQVANVVPILVNEGIGLGSPNSNKHRALIATSTPPGVLTYYPTLSGQIILAPEIQGDEYESTYGIDGAIDRPSYEYLYKRVRDDLKANYTVMQRNTPYWLGGTIKNSTTTVPSMLKFIQTYPDIINDTTGAGGLNSVKPAMLNIIVPPPPLPLPDLSFNASPTEVYSGGSAVLAWSATNSTACSASGAWSGDKTLEGTENTSNLLVAQTYTLTCLGAGGSISKDVSINIKQDTEAPAIPTNLTSVNVTANSATINWSSVTDNVGVTGYNIYKDGQKINTVTDTVFTDTGLNSGTNYIYTVTAFDQAGNESGQSVSVTVTTTANFSISNYSISNIQRSSAVVNTSLNQSGTIVVKYGKRDNSLNLVSSATTENTNHSVTLSNLERDKTYYYQITATNNSGQVINSAIASFKTRK